MGAFRVNKAFFPMIEAARGRIVNVSSELGWMSAPPFSGPYAMSKHALEAYSTSLRREVALFDVKVITIQPGPFRTGMVEDIEPEFTMAEEETPRFAHVLRRLKGLAAKQINTAHDPDILAQVVHQALTVKRPKAVYSVKPDRLRSALERLPRATADRVYLTFLRRAHKNDSD